MAMTYSQQLADPRWQRRRLERLSVSNFSCDDCGSEVDQLHVHHRHYFKGRMAWEYDDNELQVLCKTCHAGHHKAETAVKEALSRSCMGDSVFSGLVAGFLEANLDFDARGEGLLREFCADGLIAGRMAYLFFAASRDTRAKMAEALLVSGRSFNPIEAETLDMLAGYGGPHD